MAGAIGIAAGPSGGKITRRGPGGMRPTLAAMRREINKFLAGKEPTTGGRRWTHLIQSVYDEATKEKPNVNAQALLIAHAIGKPVARVESDIRVTKTVSVADRRASVMERLAALSQQPAPLAIDCEVVETAADSAELADGAGI